MTTYRRILPVAVALALALAPVACSQDQLLDGSGTTGDEPGTDADMGPGAVAGSETPIPKIATEPSS